jgi:Ca2+-binding EF-hand superfamily protein
MKNASLLNTSIMVVIVALASNFVNAEDKIKKTTQLSQKDTIEQAEFSALINMLDTDKDGVLSEAEVLENTNENLGIVFTEVDSNQDKKINEAEYNSYLAAIKNKAATLVKNITK